jgi:hypothetical protein
MNGSVKSRAKKQIRRSREEEEDGSDEEEDEEDESDDDIIVRKRKTQKKVKHSKHSSYTMSDYFADESSIHEHQLLLYKKAQCRKKLISSYER